MWRSIWMIPLFLYISSIAGCVVLFLWIRKSNATRLLARLETFPWIQHNKYLSPLLRIAAGAVFTTIVLLIPTLKFTYRIGEVIKKSTQDPVLTTIVFYWLVWWLILAATAAFKLAFNNGWPGAFAFTLLILGVGYEVFLRAQDVTAYPFSMGWSEASRYYYGSLYLAQSVYGNPIPTSPLHPSRYLLQAIPFLFSGLGLIANRFWQFLLWMVLTGTSAVAITWKVCKISDKNDKWIRVLFTAWVFLFLLRMGVYFHLEPMVFLPILLVPGRTRSWQSLAAVIISSLWAGISRVNWFPVPAMIAISIYLLEEPYRLTINFKNLGKYLKLPIIWMGAGFISALVSQAAYILFSGNSDNIQAFSSSLSSPKLWYRLLPNDTFPLGILPAILLVCGPLITVLVYVSIVKLKNLHPLRWLGLWGMLAVLFFGGLVVSVKIGGGGDLHNMDSFAVLLAIIAMYFIFDRVNSEGVTKNWEALHWPVAATAMLIPLLFLIPQLSPMPKFQSDGNQKALKQLKSLSEKASLRGPVLFINERHLLTFHQINIPLIPEYEAVTLMEMAMSNNLPYLEKFYSDLKNHRFAAIVTGKLNIGIKETGSFSDENNIWNSLVSPYIKCYYEPLLISEIPEPITYIEADESRIEFYTPRSTPGICP